MALHVDVIGRHFDHVVKPATARREHEAGQPPKQARALYRWLHDQLAPHASNEDAHEG